MQIHAKFKHRWRWCSRHENWLNCLICSVCEAHTVCWLKCHNNVIYRHVIQIVTNYIQPKWQWNLNVISIHQPSIPHQRTSAIAIQFSDLTIDKVFNEQNDVTSSTKEQNTTILFIKWKLLSGMLPFEDIKTNILHYKLFFLHTFWSKMYEKVIFCHPIALSRAHQKNMLNVIHELLIWQHDYNQVYQAHNPKKKTSELHTNVKS